MFGNNSPSLEEYFKGLNTNFLTKRSIISFLIVGIGILSIPVAVDLVKTQTNLTSKAAGEGVYRTDRGIKTVSQMKQELITAAYDSRGSQYSTEGKDLNAHTNSDIFHAYLQAAKLPNYIGCIVNKGDLNNMSITEQPFTTSEPAIVSVIQIPGQPDKGCYYTELDVYDYTDSGDPTKGTKVCTASGYRGNDYSPDRVKACHYTPTRTGINKLRVYYGGHSGGGCSDEQRVGTCEFNVGSTGGSPGGSTNPTTPLTASTISGSCTGDQATVSWTGVPGASGYNIRVDGAVVNFTGNDCGPHAICKNNYPTTSVTFKAGSGGFSAWVGAFSSQGEGPISNTATFSCDGSQNQPTNAPQSTNPSGVNSSSYLRYVCESPTQTKLVWRHVPGATSYIVKVGDQTYDVSNTANSQTRPNKTVPTQEGQSYAWSVQSKSASGELSEILNGPSFRCP